MQNHHHKTSPFECGFRAKSDEMRGIGDTAPGGESAGRGQTDASSRKADLGEQAEHVCPGLGGAAALSADVSVPSGGAKVR
jgi:hypothetical protein